MSAIKRNNKFYSTDGVIIQLAVLGIAMITYYYILNVYIAPNQEVVNIIISIRKQFKILQ